MQNTTKPSDIKVGQRVRINTGDRSEGTVRGRAKIQGDPTYADGWYAIVVLDKPQCTAQYGFGAVFTHVKRFEYI